MSTLKKLKLRQEADNITKDLYVDHVLTDLISLQVLDEEEVELINAEKTRRTQARHLLDIIQQKGGSAIDNFVKVLEKDYSWLHQKLSSFDAYDGIVNVTETDSEKNEFYDVLVAGGVPYPPPYNVKREQKLIEIRKHLRNLKRGHYLVLHGMTGSGKSCLAAGSVEDQEILMDVLKGCVFWMTVGDSAKDDILSCLIDLLDRLKMKYKSLPALDGTVILDKTKAKERLKHTFFVDQLREGLLILDDVPSAEFIELFDFGCKIMITTKDLNVMARVKGRYDVVEVNQGLTEKESLSLLAKCVNLTLDELPQEAKLIHQRCQGFPMILALLAGQLEDNRRDAQSSDGRWKHCVGLLTNKFEYIRRRSISQNEGLLKTIEFSINDLAPAFREYYFYFAVFMEDVNIKPEVLQTLWSCHTKYEAEDIMSIFIKKSLAVKKWNEQFRCSIYGIHDILLHYLKNQLSNPEKRIALHKKLLSRYHDVCNGKYAELPNDNYIYSYIGYHLSEAQEWAKFKDLFLDLTFVQSKVRVTGPADLLRDFKKYEAQITSGSEELRVKLDDYVQFIQDCGVDLYICHDLDIIQCGLLWKKNSHVYQDAYKLAKEKPEKLYLELLTDQGFVSQTPFQMVPTKEEICAACFVDDDTILIATNSSVDLWRLKNYHMVKTYYGHKNKIIRLEVHPDSKSFLSCSEDGTVKLWSLYPLWSSDISNERLPKSESENFKPSTPSALQKNWHSMFLDDPTKDESLKTSTQQRNPIRDAKFSHSGEDIVFCSEDCVIIWNHVKNTTQKVTQNTSTVDKYVSCVFSNDDSLVIIGRGDATLSIYNAKSSDFVASFRNSSSIVDVFSVKYEKNKVLVVSQNDLRIWHWEEPALPPFRTGVSDIPDNLSPTFAVSRISYYSLADKEGSATYVCAALSGDNILVVAASDYMISIWDVKRKVFISEHRNYSGAFKCLDTYVSNAMSLLMCGEDRTVKIWHIAKIGFESSLNLKPGFHAVWDSENPSALPLITSPNSKNSLQILRGGSLIAEAPSEKSEILSCTVSHSLLAVFYGCKDGHVKKYEISKKQSKIIMKLDAGVIYLQSFYCGKEILVAGDEGNLKLWKEDNTVLMCYGQTSPVIQCFLIPRTDFLLACNQDAGVKLWNVTSGQLNQVIIGHSQGTEILSTDLSENCETLVMCDKSFTIRVASLFYNAPNITISSLKLYKTETELGFVTSCKISPGGQLLALGFNTGSIQLWDLQLRQLLDKTLELHKSPVCDLYFSPSFGETHSERFLTLVSVGEKIGWWKIESCSSADSMCSSLSQLHPFKRERENTKPLASQNLWTNKKGNPGKTILLGCVNLVGLHAQNIYCSSDFSQFATIDSSGILYLLKVV